MKLVLGAEMARPGETVAAGIELRMDPGWHTYWRNPGASGMATKVEWQLPPGVTAEPLQWPAPEKVPEQDLTTYVYNGVAVLLTRFKLDPSVQAGPLEIKAKVSWLECDTQCVPGGSLVVATLRVADRSSPSPDLALLEAWRKKAPSKGGPGARAWWEKAAAGDTRPLILEWKTASPPTNVDFFPDGSDEFEIQGDTERISLTAEAVQLRKQVKKYSGEWPAVISGLLVQGAGTNRAAYKISVPVAAAKAATASAGPAEAPPAGLAAARSIWEMLLYAFLGGLVLNAMPCVLPVIALKILGFVGQAKEAPRRVRALGLIYALGVLVSFLALAGLVIGVKAAGHKAGWGMQFGNPQFLVLLTILVTLVALNLFGVFEVYLGGGVAGAADSLARRHGPAGAFLNGVLATVLATPCTAPFLSIALGFAFAHSAGIVVLFFLTIGLGLALPYVALSWNPLWLKFLPKPGAWMERFKLAMGFPMLVTALWLLSLLPIHYGDRAWWMGVFLVILSLAAWIFGEFVQRGRARRGLAMGVAVCVLAAGYFSVIEDRLHWRSPETEDNTPGPLRAEAGGIDWQPWSASTVAAARAQRRPVLVDFTARWCVTCNAVVKPAIEDPKVQERLSRINALSLLGDYTRFAADIGRELERFGRAGVPLVLVYPADPNQPPIILPEPAPLQLPSQYRSQVLAALEEAGKTER